MRDSERESAVATLVSRGERETDTTQSASPYYEGVPRENAPPVKGISRERIRRRAAQVRSANSRRSKLDTHIETEVRGVRGMVVSHTKAGKLFIQYHALVSRVRSTREPQLGRQRGMRVRKF